MDFLSLHEKKIRLRFELSTWTKDANAIHLGYCMEDTDQHNLLK